MPGNVDKSCAIAALTEGDRILIGWWEHPDIRQWLEKHAHKYREQLLGLARALTQSGPAVREAQRAVLKSSSGRICCFVHAALKRGEKFSREEIEERTSALRPWKACGEPVTAVFVKGEGKTRLTAKLGPNRLCLNYLVRDVLLVMWGMPDDEYSCSGRGTHRLVQAIMAQIRRGSDWVGMADVKDCFPSFRQEGLSKRIKLPEDVVQYAVFLREDVEVQDHNGFPVAASVRDTLRRGLPQGTPTSAIISSLLLADLTRPAAFDEAVFRYADNLFWLGRDEAGVVATLSTLKQSFGSASAGELTLHKISIRNSDDGFKCLGYKVITDPKTDTYVPRLYPCATAFGRHWARLQKVLSGVPLHLRQDLALELTEQWRLSWKAWDPSADMIDRVFDQALELASSLNEFEGAAHK